ncbi:MAG: hypothetical protein ACFFCE_17660 [Promethearchaeota archaeon]
MKKRLVNWLKMIVKSFFISFFTIFVLSLVIIGIAFSIITIIPDKASKPCYLGYYAHCSFTPYSTIILLVMALIGTLLLIKLIKYFKSKYTKTLEKNSKVQVLAKSISK